jgi:hypothetical protein
MIAIQACPGKNARPYLKNNYSKKDFGGEGMASIVQPMPSQ